MPLDVGNNRLSFICSNDNGIIYTPAGEFLFYGSNYSGIQTHIYYNTHCKRTFNVVVIVKTYVEVLCYCSLLRLTVINIGGGCDQQVTVKLGVAYACVAYRSVVPGCVRSSRC